MPSANIILIMDKSTSMSVDQYFIGVQTDCATFVQIMKTNDNLGVVTLSSSSQIIVPSSGNQMVPITGLPVQNQAVQAIVGTGMAGSTNMVDVISVSHGMIASAATPRAIVLVSDGEWNTGGDPLPNLPTNVPIYTIALGPSAGLQTLQTIANRTVGQGQGYYYAPNGWDLGTIYNNIVSQARVRSLTANAQPLLPNYTFQTFPAILASGNSQGCFAVSWNNQAVIYTSGTPGGQQISVLLRDPNGNNVTPDTVAPGPGFVVLNVNNPIPGQWQVGTWTANTGNLQTTVSAYDSNTQLTLDLQFDVTNLKVGTPVPFIAGINYGGQPVKGAIVKAVAESPLISIRQALTDHKNELAKLKIPKFHEQAPDEAMYRLKLLRERKLSKDDILQRSTYPVNTNENKSGEHHGNISMTKVPGSHTLRVQVTGNSPIDGTLFSRVAQLSVHLE